MKGETALSQIHRLNRFLLPLLLVLVIFAVGDLTRAALKPELPLDPVTPSLEDLERPLAAVPALDLLETLFQPAAPPKEEPVKSLLPPKIQWKLLGVSLGATKRAFLQDPEGKQSAWVTEGETIGASLVKEIRERSVVLEEAGATVEIRL